MPKASTLRKQHSRCERPYDLGNSIHHKIRQVAQVLEQMHISVKERTHHLFLNYSRMDFLLTE